MKKLASLAEWRKRTVRAPIQHKRSAPVEGCYLELGAIVLEMRERRGWPQEHVASAMGWTRASIANIEGGKQRVMLHDLPRLAAVLGLPVRDLLPAAWLKRGINV